MGGNAVRSGVEVDRRKSGHETVTAGHAVDYQFADEGRPAKSWPSSGHSAPSC